MNDHHRTVSALQTIPCPPDWTTWNQIGIEAVAAGLSLDDVDEWSSQGPNYKGTKSVTSNFKGVTPEGGIGPGSLFKRAMEAGWSDPIKGARHNGHERPKPSRPVSSLTRPTKAANKSAIDVPDQWNRFAQVTEHGYIAAKRGRPDGLRVVPDSDPLTIQGQSVVGWLAVPAWSFNGELRTIQFIPPPGIGKKLNLPGASFDDGLFVVGDLAECDRIYIVEGIGQAWACWAATGRAAVVCFGAGRMSTVAEILRRAHPDKRLVVVPDRRKEAQAAEIARAVSGEWIELPEDKPANYDVNDYALDHGADELAELLHLTKAPSQRFRLMTAADLSSMPPNRWRIRGVLPQAGIGAVFGPSGSGKSFLVLDMLAAVVTSPKWFNCRVKRAPVLYVGLEGEAGIAQRVQAHQIRYGELPHGFRFLLTPLDIRKTDDRAELVKAARAAGLADGVLVLDTLNRAAPGMDENDSRDMGEAIDAAKALQRDLGGLVLLVHHTGKDAARGLRGHSSLHAALDCAIEVRRDGDRREWLIAKSKDGNDGESNPFKLDVLELGVDEDGEPVTSCVVHPIDEVAGNIRRILPPKSGNQKAVWDALGEVFRKAGDGKPKGAPDALPSGRPCVTLEHAIEQTRTKLVCEPKRQTERCQAALRGLVERGLLCHEAGFLWSK